MDGINFLCVFVIYLKILKNKLSAWHRKFTSMTVSYEKKIVLKHLAFKMVGIAMSIIKN